MHHRKCFFKKQHFLKYIKIIFENIPRQSNGVEDLLPFWGGGGYLRDIDRYIHVAIVCIHIDKNFIMRNTILHVGLHNEEFSYT